MNINECQAMGTRIREARIVHALSQTDLARKIGVSPPYIQEIEEGLALMDLETLVKICNALSLWPDYTLGRSKTNTYNDDGLRLLN